MTCWNGVHSTGDYRRNKLRSIADVVEMWELHVQQEKAVFHTLNLFNYDVTNKCLIAEGWCPTSMLPEVREALRRGTALSGASVQSVINIVKTKETPPTYFRTNKLTAGFQNIVSAYGTAPHNSLGTFGSNGPSAGHALRSNELAGLTKIKRVIKSGRSLATHKDSIPPIDSPMR